MKRNFFLSLACELPIVLYVLTASRTLPWGDGAEFYVAVKNLGIPHPSGYPLFILLGRALFLFNRSPFLLNLLPGLCTVCAVYFLYRITCYLTKAPLLSFFIAFFFATGQAIWQQSVAAEVYTLNLCLFLILLFFILHSEDEPRYILPAFFIAGLALTNHLTSILYVLPCGIYLLLKKPHSFRYIPFFVVPLVLYIYFPIRSIADPVPDLFNPETFSNLISFVSGRSFLYRTFSFTGTSLSSDIISFLSSWWHQCLILLPLGVYGIFAPQNRRQRILFLVIMVLVFGYTLFYQIPDKQGYYLPFYAVWFIFISFALVKIIPPKYRLLLCALPVIGVIANYRACDLSKETSLHDLGTAMYAGLPDNAIFFSDDYFVYYDMVNREGPSHKKIIPIVQFYLRMEWYIDHLKEHYPDLIISESVTNLINNCSAQLKKATRLQYGKISKQCCLAIQDEIAQANLDDHPVYLFMYNDDTWPHRTQKLFLQYHGLFYQFQQDSVAPLIFEMKAPSPTDYNVSNLTNTDAIYVGKKFAAAFNRRGINRFQNGDASGAVNDLNMALRYYPEYHQVYANLGLAYLNMGDTVATLNSWRTYLQQAPAGPQYDRVQTWYTILQNNR